MAHRDFRRRARQRRLRRRLGSALPRFGGDEADAVAAAIDAARLAPEVAAAIAALPSSERDVVELVTIGGLSPADAAAALGISANAARLRLSRARARMRTAFPSSAPSLPLDRVVSRVGSPQMISARTGVRSQGRTTRHSRSCGDEDDVASGVQDRRNRGMTSDSGH